MLVAGLLPSFSRQSESAYAAGGSTTITITHQPVGGTFAKGGTVRLYVQVSSQENTLLAYQWYRSDTNAATGGTPVGNGTSICDDVPSSAGTYYYYAVVSDTRGASATSGTARVVVEPVSLGTSLENGDFENPGSSTSNDWYKKDLPYWNTTHYVANLAGDPDGCVVELNAGSRYGVANRGQWSAELSPQLKSTIYQEIATVPGRVYEWSLEHAARSSNVTVPSGTDTMALVIGPATVGRYTGSVTTPTRTYPYGQNDATLFQSVVDRIPASERTNKSTHVVRIDPATGNEVQSGGDAYYVYIASDDMHAGWGAHAGYYTVPEGQGETVFGFVSVASASGSSQVGNVLDSIEFSAGSGAAIDSTVDYSGGGVLSTTVADSSYRYGILEVRGSTTFAAQGANVTLDGKPCAEAGNGWYAPDGTGKLAFSNLTPGKTYRVVAVPAGAINADLQANLAPSTVLDENYYSQATVKAVADSSSGSGGNIQATAQAADDGTARIIIKPARDDVEYALLQTTSDGSTPLPDGVQQSWTVPDAGAGTLSFEGLDRSRSYAVVARAKGYSEVTYRNQVQADSFVIVKTPSQYFKDVSADDGSVVRTVDAPQSIVVKNTSGYDQRYLVYDALTGEGNGQGWLTAQNNTSVVFAVEPAGTYQVVAAEPATAPSPGIRSYGLAPAPQVDYVNETVGKDGIVPVTVEYRMQDNADAGLWYFGSSDKWEAGSGGTALSLAAPLDSMAERASTAGATLQYRLKKDVEPAIAIESSVVVPSRPLPPSEGGEYELDYVNEQVKAGLGRVVQVRAQGSSTWVELTGGAVPFADLGWAGSEKAMEVRMAAVADGSDSSPAFASAIANELLAARPATPVAGDGGVMLVKATGSDCSLIGVDTSMEYSLDGGSTWQGGAADGAQTVTVQTGVAVLVRVKATAAAPASLPLELAPTSLYVALSGSFGSSPAYGYAVADAEAAAAKLAIKNSSQSGSLKVTKVSLAPGSNFTLSSGSQTGVTEVEFVPAIELAPNARIDDISVVPNTGLAAGVYKARVTAEYTDAAAASVFRASTELLFTVTKAPQDAPTGLIAKTQTSGSLALSAVAPSTGTTSGVVQFSNTGGSTWSAGSAVAGGSASATFDGLTSATVYTCTARMAGDANHEASAAYPLAAFATAHGAPALSDRTIDYYAETLSFSPDFEACTNTADVAGSAYASGSLLTGLLDGVGSTVQLRHRQTTAEAPAGVDAAGGTVNVPASSWLAVPLARPSISAGTTSTDATDSRTPDGSITVSGVAAFQYRLTTNENWITVSGTTMSGLVAGTYSVRALATGSSFASAPLQVVIAAKTCFVSFDTNGGESAAPGEQTVSTGSTANEPPVPTRVGYEFSGWHASPDGGTTLDPDPWVFSSPVTADIALYANWVPYEYSVTFESGVDAGDVPVVTGSMGSQPFEYGTAQALDACGFERANYQFSGWSLTRGGPVKYEDGASVLNLTAVKGGSVTLYAVWKRPTINATMPLTATVSVAADGVVSCPDPLDPNDPAAGGYGIASTTDASLKVDSISCALDARATEVFPGGAAGLTLQLNGTALSIGAVGLPAVVRPDGFALASASADAPSYLPLSISLKLTPGTEAVHQGDAEVPFARFVYTLAYDDAAAATLSEGGDRE